MSKDYSAIAAAPADQQSSGQTLIPLAKGTPNFHIMCHPTAWECVETDRGYEWLPRLKVFQERAGVNGVKEVSNSRGEVIGVDSAMSRTRLTDQGWIIVPRDFCPDEVMDFDSPRLPGQGYVVAYKGRGGWVHLARWDKPVYDEKSFETKTNRAQLWAFQRALIAKGLVKPPAERVVEREMRIKRRRLERNATKSHLPNFAHRVQVVKAEIEGMQIAASAQRFGEPLTAASLKSEVMARLQALEIAFDPSESKKDLLSKYEAHVAASAKAAS
jgi:hypothetical protein